MRELLFCVYNFSGMNVQIDKYCVASLVVCAILFAPYAKGSVRTDTTYLLPTLSLDTCRARALRCSKSLQIAQEVVEQSRYLVKAAQGVCLPRIDFATAAFYNQKKIQLVDVESLKNKITDWGIPSGITSAIIPDDLLAFDTHKVMVGAVTITQPLYVGGKIRALNDVAKNAGGLAVSQQKLLETEVITAVDDAYWLIVSLSEKRRLAQSFVALIDTLQTHVTAMTDVGMATRGDGLTVAVAFNKAQVALLKVESALTMSHMALARLCGMPIDTLFSLQDESAGFCEVGQLPSYGLTGVYGRREEVRSLQFLANMTHAQQRIALSSMLPSVVLVGMYSFNAPNLYDGFKTDIAGMFRVGVLLQIPVFHWGTNYYRYKAARSATLIADIEIELAKERIALQVSEELHRYNAAVRTYRMTLDNMEQAEENLRNARLSFSEGVFTVAEVLAAQTAWLEAHSECIDARISVELSRNAYNRAVGLPLY